jgi:adenylate cyclase
MKKILLSPWLALLTLSLVVGLRISDPSLVESIRLRYFDTLIINRAAVESNQVATVNIDDETIQKYGQFPFPRDVYSKIIIDLYNRGAGLVVFNIFTPDKDRFGKDAVLQNTLQTIPVVIPQVGTNDNLDFGVAFNPGVAEIGEPAKPWTPQYKTIQPSVFKDTIGGIGVVNTLPEIDGVVRRMPMLVTANDVLYPSIAMETLRVAAGDISFQVKSNEFGIEAVRIPQYGKIDTDEFGRIWIDWSKQSKQYSLTNLPETFEGKIVIVGLTARGLNNPVATARGEQYPHAIQSTILETIIGNTNISRPIWATVAEIGFTILLSIISLLLIRWKYGFIPVIVIIGGIHTINTYVFGNYRILLDSTIPVLGVGLVYFHAYTVKFVTELNAKLQIKKQFGTYLSPALVEKLQKNPELLKLGGESRELSIMFTDVRGFTSISEHYGKNVQGLTEIMNRYMTAMTAKIIENNGTLDKYIGDAQMAFWNAPLDEPTHAKQAVKTALEMMESLNEFNKKIEVEGVPAFGMGLGINTATVVVGNMGSVQRFDYTCLGDGVNLASRLEGQSKPYGVKIVLGTDTADQVKDEYFVLELDKIAVKGKKEGVNIYTVLGHNDTIKFDTSAVKKHNFMLLAYRSQIWKQADVLCNELKGEFGGLMDHYYDMMKDRIGEYEYSKSLPRDWDGTFVATSK